jgi:hypothetical protein
MLFAALILRTDRRIVRKLRETKANSIDSAIPLKIPPILGSWRLHRLAGVGAICLVQPERYYLDEKGYAAFRKRRRRRALLIISTLIPLILIMWVWVNLQ